MVSELISSRVSPRRIAAPALGDPGVRRLLGLALLLALCAAGYMLIGAKAPWSFLLPFRGAKLAALGLVGASLSVATVLFQTAARNRILTPAAVGFDSLYLFVLTGLVAGLGAGGYAALPQGLLFAINLCAMTALAVVLFALLGAGRGGDIARLALTGIVIGMLIRSLTGFLSRMLDPSEFAVVQADAFARFTLVDVSLLAVAACAAVPAMGAAWALRRRFDVLALGPETAAGLGENPVRLRLIALGLTCTLTAAATALAGPMAGGFGAAGFFGLIVSALAHRIAPSVRHGFLLPAAALIGAAVLVGGQLLMERVFALATPLSVVIEVTGGALFLWMLRREAMR